jgi:hypothetical protein
LRQVAVGDVPSVAVGAAILGGDGAWVANRQDPPPEMDPDPTSLSPPLSPTEPKGSLRKTSWVFVTVFVAVGAAVLLLLVLLGMPLRSAWETDAEYMIGIPGLAAFVAAGRYRQTGSLKPRRVKRQPKDRKSFRS